MKHPKVYIGQIVLINEDAYACITGLHHGQPTHNRIVYNVALRSVKYDPDRIPEWIRCKNTELPPFKKL